MIAMDDFLRGYAKWPERKLFGPSGAHGGLADSGWMEAAQTPGSRLEMSAG
jgi:hypothetical protein